MFLFNRLDVYIGFSIAEVNKVLDALAAARIKYGWKTGSGYAGLGAIRGQDSYGNTINCSCQYTVYVKKKDAETARYLVNKALHQV
jgi:hypothetical protein